MGLCTRASQVAVVVKNLSANAGDIRDIGLIPGLGRSPGGGHGNPLQYSCLENPWDRGAWQLESIGSHRVKHNSSNLARTQSVAVKLTIKYSIKILSPWILTNNMPIIVLKV